MGATDRCALRAILAAHVSLLCVSATVHSPALDEVGHLPAGLIVWEAGRFDLYRVNPPLVKAIAALPVLASGASASGINYDPQPRVRPEWTVGRDFIAGHGPRAFVFWTYARWACVPLSLLGAYLCSRWTGELFGPRAGVLAAALWCFCPNIIGNGSMITPDVGAASLGLLAAYTFARWLNRPTVGAALLCGVALGLAQLTKTSWVILFGLWPLVFMAHRWAARRAGGAARHAPAWQLVLILFIGLDVLNLGYLCQGTFTPLGDYQFQSQALSGLPSDAEPPTTGNRFSGTWLAHFPVPLPWDYVVGLDVQKLDFEQKKWSYLFGEFKLGGWWYYYAVALLFKVPLGYWMLAGLAVCCAVRERERQCSRFSVRVESSTAPGAGQAMADQRASRGQPSTRGASGLHCVPLADRLVLTATPLALFVLVSSETGFSRYVRYALPCFPFAFIAISRVARVFDRAVETRGSGVETGITQADEHRTPNIEHRTSNDPSTLDAQPLTTDHPPLTPPHRRDVVLRVLIVGALAWGMGSSLWQFPHSLSYMNELAGGPKRGHRYLNHANLSWGQDVFFLRDWIAEHPEAQPLTVAYLSFFDMSIAGVNFPVTPSYAPGRATIGPQGDDVGPRPGWHIVDITYLRSHQHEYDYFHEFEPMDYVAGSMHVFCLSRGQADAARQKLGLPPFRGDPVHQD